MSIEFVHRRAAAIWKFQDAPLECFGRVKGAIEIKIVTNWRACAARGASNGVLRAPVRGRTGSRIGAMERLRDVLSERALMPVLVCRCGHDRSSFEETRSSRAIRCRGYSGLMPANLAALPDFIR